MKKVLLALLSTTMLISTLSTADVNVTAPEKADTINSGSVLVSWPWSSWLL